MKNYKLIPLTKNKFTKVDPEYFDWASQRKWHYAKGGYAARGRTINGKERLAYLHRELLNPPKGLFTDHINGDGLDNRLKNLRVATKQQNSFNSKRHINNKSGYKGVSLSNWGKWEVAIEIGNKRVFRTFCDTKEEAALAYKNAAKKYFGEFAYLGV